MPPAPSSRPGPSAAADATAFLLAQQCTSGFFRESFTKDKAATAQGCVEGQADSAASLDATALAVVNLVESGSHDKAVADGRREGRHLAGHPAEGVRRLRW